MALVSGSGTGRNTNQSLQDALGMNDYIPNRPVTGGGALQRDLDQAVQEHWNAGEGWSDWVGGDSGVGGIEPSYPESDYSSYVPELQPVSIPMLTSPQSMQVSELLPSSAPIGLSGSSGMQPSMTKPISVDDVAQAVENIAPMYNKAGLDEWEREAAEREGRPVRTVNMFGEEYDTPEFLDNQLDLIGNTQTNDAYMRYAVANGLSEDDAYAIMHKPQSIKEEEELRATRTLSPDVYDGTGGLLDDGSLNYFDLTADKMTGAQYLKYAELGMGGRPTGEIVPSDVYSKRREANNYGFIPFTPDESSYLNMVTSNTLDLPWRLGSMVGNLRETLTPDYAINYGDQRVSGRDFDKLYPAYLGQFDYYDKFDPGRYLTKPEGENYTPHIFEHVIPDVNGNETYHYGSLRTVDANPDGTYSIGFNDGSSVDVSQDYIDTVYNPENDSINISPSRVPVNKARGKVPDNIDSLNDVNAIMAAAEGSGASPLDYADVIYVPDLVLSDGTRMSFEDVDRLSRDKTEGDDADNPNDDDIRYEFGSGILPFATNKPRRLMEQEPISFEDGKVKVNFGDMVNNTWDWTLGSIPISVGNIMPWLYSASGATSSVNGVDPGTYSPSSDSYGLISGSYDEKGNAIYGVPGEDGKRDDALSDSTRWWNAAGNALVPLTEQIVGPVGGQVIPLEKMFGSQVANPTVGQVLKNFLIGAAGEGIEEDLGNIFEDLTQYGWQGLFANQRKDENGNPLYDDFGRHELRDYGTSLEDRITNAFDPSDLANAFLGGAAVDFAMDTLLSPINKGSFTRQIGPAVQRDLARRKTGVKQYVESEPERMEREAQENGEALPERKRLSESYLSGFDRNVD